MGRLNSGDVYISCSFGDLWTVCDNDKLVRINTGETVYPDTMSDFLKIGKIDEVQNLDTSFYEQFDCCPICNSLHVECKLDMSSLKWKIGCNTKTCPCCVDHMIGKYTTRADAVRNWNRIE